MVQHSIIKSYCKIVVFFITIFFLITEGYSAETVPAQTNKTIQPAKNITIKDYPGDLGTSLIIEWELSEDDQNDPEKSFVIAYEIHRRTEKTEYKFLAQVTYQKNFYRDQECEPDKKYWYQITAIGRNDLHSTPAESANPGIPVLQWFDSRKGWIGILMLFSCSLVVYFISIARKGKKLKIRKIAGLDAVEEAVGRATEMGSSCLFVPGILDVNDIQTIAGITILSHVAEVTAEYETDLVVPTCRSLVMTMAREAVETSYLTAGKPDAYNEDDIYYLTDEQFGYVAGIQGTMVRDKPAACFYMGAFYAESLLLAETGNSIGAIQIAGTAMPSQLPFFVAACDYTLIGEELFAASAYLSGEPDQLGSLKGQDYGKLLCAALIIIGCTFATLSSLANHFQWGTGMESSFSSIQTYVSENILGEKGFRP
jgi:Domain of unknown function (DUF6754)